MNNVHAKPIVEGKFWIVEEDQKKVGILKVNEQRKYVLSSKDTVETFDNKKKLLEKFGKGFFNVKEKIEESVSDDQKVIYDYPCSSIPYNPVLDIKKHLPLFTKSDKSKSVYCAGHYIIKFEKGWVKSFCPKLITLERYEFQGPFKTELEMKQRLSNANKQH